MGWNRWSKRYGSSDHLSLVCSGAGIRSLSVPGSLCDVHVWARIGGNVATVMQLRRGMVATCNTLRRCVCAARKSKEKQIRGPVERGVCDWAPRVEGS